MLKRAEVLSGSWAIKVVARSKGRRNKDFIIVIYLIIPLWTLVIPIIIMAFKLLVVNYNLLNYKVTQSNKGR
jgi:uncharacterized membrane protein